MLPSVWSALWDFHHYIAMLHVETSDRGTFHFLPFLHTQMTNIIGFPLNMADIILLSNIHSAESSPALLLSMTAAAAIAYDPPALVGAVRAPWLLNAGNYKTRRLALV